LIQIHREVDAEIAAVLIEYGPTVRMDMIYEDSSDSCPSAEDNSENSDSGFSYDSENSENSESYSDDEDSTSEGQRPLFRDVAYRPNNAFEESLLQSALEVYNQNRAGPYNRTPAPLPANPTPAPPANPTPAPLANRTAAPRAKARPFTEEEVRDREQPSTHPFWGS